MSGVRTGGFLQKPHSQSNTTRTSLSLSLLSHSTQSTGMDVPKDQIVTLLEHGLYTSAQTLVFFISHFPYKINFHFFTLKFQFRFTLIRLICLNQGCFLVSSSAANAETSPHIKAESLVWIFFLIFFSISISFFIFPLKFENFNFFILVFFAIYTAGSSQWRFVSRARVSPSNCKNKHTHSDLNFVWNLLCILMWKMIW